MPSIVWGRVPREAFEEPYEYGAQDQFVREAEKLQGRLYRLLNSEAHHYSIEDASTEKAVWLLAMDALDSLRDCLRALIRKEHRVAGRLFRDATETMDLAAFLRSGDTKSQACLRRWYADKIVPHREYRDYVQRTRSASEARELAKHYSSLSRFTHRSYRAILDGYVAGRGNRLAHDRSGELYREGGDASFLVLPQILASYYAVLANLIAEYAALLPELGLVSKEDVRDAFASSLEAGTIPRRFYPRRWLAERLRNSEHRGHHTEEAV